MANETPYTRRELKDLAAEAMKSYLTAYLLQPSRIDINLWCSSIVPDCIKIAKVMLEKLDKEIKE